MTRGSGKAADSTTPLGLHAAGMNQAEKPLARVARRNRYTFGLGTIGRDMGYTLVSMYLIFYLTEVRNLSNTAMWWITGIMLADRIFEALNDPFMGVIVDNTRSRYGKFKPWIVFGAITSGLLTVLLFTDFGLGEAGTVAVFAVCYVLYGLAFTTNDIGYWSMMPSLTTDQAERERIGSIARICANVGMFAVVVGVVPVTNALGQSAGSMEKGYFLFAIGIVVILLLGQCVTLFGVREPKGVFKQEERTRLREMFGVVLKNDQLLFVAVSMSLFMIGYCTTTSFGLYFFKYAYGDEGMYSIFALVLGISQITALVAFPAVSRRIGRKTLYAAATVLVLLGYALFFFAPMSMSYIAPAGLLLFVGQAFIQILMLMFLADSIEYGQWKLGRRNESITFSLQPLINQIGGAVGSGIVSATVILSGINDAQSAADVTAEGLFLMKMAMMVLPLVFIVSGYLLYRWKFRIDRAFYEKILVDLEARGDLVRVPADDGM